MQRVNNVYTANKIWSKTFVRIRTIQSTYIDKEQLTVNALEL